MYFNTCKALISMSTEATCGRVCQIRETKVVVLWYTAFHKKRKCHFLSWRNFLHCLHWKDNFRCNQWRNRHQNYKISGSLHPYINSFIRVINVKTIPIKTTFILKRYPVSVQFRVGTYMLQHACEIIVELIAKPCQHISLSGFHQPHRPYSYIRAGLILDPVVVILTAWPTINSLAKTP